jgi:hypothetical protein
MYSDRFIIVMILGADLWVVKIECRLHATDLRSTMRRGAGGIEGERRRLDGQED